MQMLTTTIIRAAALALLLGMPAFAFAQGAATPAGEGAQRQRLTQEQRDEQRKRWEAMSPDERQKVIDERRARRAEALAKMTPEERQRAEARQQAARDRWAKMTPEERDALRKRAAERRAQSGSRASN
jgi:predicted Fe-S protein YdhL (DUF1289 family)